ncbi:MAG TPA: FKBP-type peptidyl-prolyl cis-trans isomerase [Verrucomicrobiae bacterium]|nr:FKBP-type peptidyl-prolyl cis-trans isomerase [Verrucomicrobiae bacterium]
MKKVIFSLICLGSAAAVYADSTNAFNDDNARVSYAIGMLTGHSWQQQGVDFDVDTYAKGIKDGKGGGTTLMTADEAQATIAKFKQEFTAKQQKLQAEKGVKNKADGDAFLAANKNNPGVTTLDDGLQYLVITNGTGTMPAASDTVTVNYRGTLIDGTEFDSSYKRGQPASFPVGGVIHGWTEALQKMKVGSKWKLFIPANLAYGEAGRPGIPPNSTLIFEVELLDIKASTPPPPQQPVAPLTSDIIKVPSAEEMKKGAKIEVIKPEDAAKMQQNGGK